jgi:lipid A 3-O-deacylase
LAVIKARRRTGVVLVASALGFMLCFAPDKSLAQDNGVAQDKGIVDELKLGVLAHDITLGGRSIESGADLNGEVLFNGPSFLDYIGAPRPHLGLAINTDGNTDQAYFGLTWGLPIVKSIVGQSDALTVYGSLGGALQDGYVDSAPAGRKRLGSVILFREAVELGYQITPVYSISAIVDHISNANLGNHNAGITSAGARIGIKF